MGDEIMNAVTLTDSPRIVELKKEFRTLSEEHVRLQAVIAPEQFSAAVSRIAEITARKLIIATEVFNESTAVDLAGEYQS